MFIILEGNEAAYRQIYCQIRHAVMEGRLSPGDRLPASRQLAGQLGVARITVVQAYEQLVAEGYLEARSGAGTQVTRTLEGRLDKPESGRDTPAPRTSTFAARSRDMATGRSGTPRPALRWDFQYCHPTISSRLHADWQRALRQAAAQTAPGYPDSRGESLLRECLASFLRDRRGLLAHPDQIVIVTGIQQALDLIGRCTLDPGSGVIMEEPHYQGARQVFQALGARLHALPVDEDGLQTDHLPPRGRADTPRLACVTPSHQFPLGGVLPVGRRLALLRWAEDNDAFLIEDDYDSEYRHEGPPLQSMFSLDRGRRVLYLGTFSKVLFPGLRLGYMVVPEPWMEPLQRLKWLTDRGSPALEQRALVELFRSGAFRRHVNRTARLLGRRRSTLVEALKSHFGDQVSILGTRAGVHLVTRWPELNRSQGANLAAAAADHGVGVYPTDSYYMNSPPDVGELLLGYAGLDRIAIDEGIAALARAFRTLRT